MIKCIAGNARGITFHDIFCDLIFFFFCGIFLFPTNLIYRFFLTTEWIPLKIILWHVPFLIPSSGVVRTQKILEFTIRWPSNDRYNEWSTTFDIIPWNAIIRRQCYKSNDKFQSRNNVLIMCACVLTKCVWMCNSTRLIGAFKKLKQ